MAKAVVYKCVEAWMSVEYVTILDEDGGFHLEFKASPGKLV